MTEPATRPFKFIGGNAALDFINSVDGWSGGQPRGDQLGAYGDLLAWAEGAGAIDPRTAKRLRSEAAQRPREAARTLARAVELRQLLHRLFAAVATGRHPAAADLQALNVALARMLPHQMVVATGEGFAWAWEDSPALDAVLWPVLRAAADLLTSGRLGRLRECGGDNCGWLFLDETKNRSRRWCEMSVCGNRAKARRHYRRARGLTERAAG